MEGLEVSCSSPQQWAAARDQLLPVRGHAEAPNLQDNRGEEKKTPEGENRDHRCDGFSLKPQLCSSGEKGRDAWPQEPCRQLSLVTKAYRATPKQHSWEAWVVLKIPVHHPRSLPHMGNAEFFCKAGPWKHGT